MLYERWLQVAQDYADDLAVWDHTTGARWTFAELAANAAERKLNGTVSYPSGNSAEFLLDVLAGWREGKPVCPLEKGQSPPALLSLPTGCVHAKMTSGSSGAPRAVLFNARQLEADARQIISTMGLRRDWPNLGTISLAHSYGFSNLVTPLLLFGIPLILASAPFPEVIATLTREAGMVTLPAVPALWKIWHEAGVLGSPIKLAISAGAPLPLALEQDVYERSNIKIHNFYGATECGGIGYDRTEEPRTNGQLIGSAMDGVKLEKTEGGLLLVKSAAAGLGYWPEIGSALQGGSFQTTDLVEFAGENILLTGRATDIINVAGRKVAPELIETALRAHPLVEHVVVFGVPAEGEERNEEIAACIRMKHGKQDSPELKRFLTGMLPSWQVPRIWWFEAALEPNNRGKIPRAEWKKRFMARQLAG